MVFFFFREVYQTEGGVDFSLCESLPPNRITLREIFDVVSIISQQFRTSFHSIASRTQTNALFPRLAVRSQKLQLRNFCERAARLAEEVSRQETGVNSRLIVRQR